VRKKGAVEATGGVKMSLGGAGDEESSSCVKFSSSVVMGDDPASSSSVGEIRTQYHSEFGYPSKIICSDEAEDRIGRPQSAPGSVCQTQLSKTSEKQEANCETDSNSLICLDELSKTEVDGTLDKKDTGCSVETTRVAFSREESPRPFSSDYQGSLTKFSHSAGDEGCSDFDTDVTHCESSSVNFHTGPHNSGGYQLRNTTRLKGSILSPKLLCRIALSKLTLGGNEIEASADLSEACMLGRKRRRFSRRIPGRAAKMAKQSILQPSAKTACGFASSVVSTEGEEIADEVDCPLPSTPQQKEARRLARLRQLREMRARETIEARRERALKRKGELSPSKRRPTKKVSWKTEGSLTRVMEY
jgi:hypothetical protein